VRGEATDLGGGVELVEVVTDELKSVAEGVELEEGKLGAGGSEKGCTRGRVS
jgi:hypothetical protein